MGSVVNHFATHVSTYRSFANFSSMACEQFWKNSSISEIAQTAFISLNGFFALKEGAEFYSQGIFNWETWGPRLANCLNVITAVSPIFYVFGYTYTPFFILACASRIIPYATNLLKGSSYTPLLQALNPQFDWLQFQNTSLNTSVSPDFKKEMQQLIENGKGFREIYHRYKELVDQMRDPNARTNASITDFLEKNRGKLLETMSTTLETILREVDGEEAAIQMRLSVSLRTLIQAIDTTPHQNLQRKLQENLEGLRNLDLLIQFASFILGVAYVCLLIVYNGAVPYEGLIYLSFGIYALYDFWKERKIQELDLSTIREFQQLHNQLHELVLTPIEDAHTELHDAFQVLPPEQEEFFEATPSPRSDADK